MKSRRSVIRAILFMLRLQKSVSISRESRRSSSSQQQSGMNSNHENHRSHHHRFLSRAESTRHRRRSSLKQSSQHRNSAPGGALPHRSPSLVKFIHKPAHVANPDAPVHFGAFSAMSQPYSVGLTNARGAPILSVCAGAAHTLASTALMCRQQSLDEYASRSLMSPSVGSSVLTRGVQRQASVESFNKRRKYGEDSDKKSKTSMISIMSALIAIEQDEVDSLEAALKKGVLEPTTSVTCGAFSICHSPWSLLDISLCLNSVKCAKALIAAGARESRAQNSFEMRRRAVDDAVSLIEERRATIRSTLSAKEFEKQSKQLNTQRALFGRMETVLGRPQLVDLRLAKIEANSAHSVLLFPEIAANFIDSSVVIKYKVEWSDTRTFDTVLGSSVVTNTQRKFIEVANIKDGPYLSFRVSASTIHDYGDPIPCTPAVVEMSSWEEVCGERESRADQLASVLNLTEAVEKHRQSLVWQRVFPSNENGQRKKKNGGMKDLFRSSAKFTKNTQTGCYLASLVYCEGKILCTVEDVLPCFCIDEAVTTLNKEDMQWLLKLSLSWDQLSALSEANPTAYSNNIALSFRAKVINAANDLMNALNLKDIGRLAQPVYHDNVIFLTTVRYVTGVDAVTGLTTHWTTFEKMLRKRVSCPAMDKLMKESLNLMNFFESSQIPLEKGLYVAYLKMHSSLNSIRLVVPDNLPSVLPYVSVRENPHVTKDEWDWIKAIDSNQDIRPTANQRIFHRQLSTSINTLLHDLDVDPDLVPGHRMLTSEILQLNKDVSLILILPKPEDVCSAPTGSNHQADAYEQRRGFHLSTYCPQFISAYCKLSIFLDHFSMIAQFEQRKCLLEHDSKVYRTQLETLTEFQKQLDDVWAESRWITRIGSLARDKTSKLGRCTIPLSRLLAPITFTDTMDPGYISDVSSTDRPDPSAGAPLSRFPRPQSMMGSPSISLSDFDRILSLRRHRSTERPKPRAIMSSPNQTNDKGSAVVVVFAAFESGLAKGTSVRLSITPSTTSQEIVALVVEQLTKVSAKNAGVKIEEVVIPDFSDYCLVVVIGARERRLRDDFALLKLQNPWAKGKIFVRRKDNVCSAVNCGNEALV